MTSPCTAPTTRTALTRTGALAVVFGLAFAPVLTPAVAYAQDAENRTVQAILGADGAVTDVTTVGGGDAAADSVPVTVAISQTPDGDSTTTNYVVENTSAVTKSVSYQNADGTTASSEQEVALPLVAQLSVRVPASRTDVQATGARITQLADGSQELVWSMVLFSPIGAPTSEVSFTSKGTGNPVARIDVAPVSPTSAPGLAGTAQALNATVNGNGILNTVANGANEGLLKLADGVGQLLAGLDKLEAGANQLNEGIAAGADGASQLAAGSAEAKKGSAALSTGLGQLAAGGGAASDGASQLAAGLAQISGGLDQLSAAQGLPAALDGAQKLRAGVDALRAGLGAPETEGTLLNGLAQIAGGLQASGAGLDQVSDGLDGLGAGLPAAKGGVDQVAAGLGAATATGGPADQITALLGVVRAGLAGCAPGAPVPAPANPCEALNTALFAISHPAGATGATDAGGVKEQLKAAAAGLGQVSTGLGAAVTGVGQLSAGVDQLQAGNTALSAGTAAVTAGAGQVAAGLVSGDPLAPGLAEGLDSLVGGLTTAVGGVGQLAVGARDAASGSTDLAAGNRALADGAQSAYTGSRELDAGIGKIADGQRQVADGLPAAVDGSGELADGVSQVVEGEEAVAKGLSDLRTQAVAVLQSQFAQGTTLARQQLAGLDASTALLAETPGAAGTTYVLTQDADGIVANLASAETGSSDVARNVGLGVGGALLLMGGLAAGSVIGRRRATV